jgi:hypothetical protein
MSEKLLRTEYYSGPIGSADRKLGQDDIRVGNDTTRTRNDTTNVNSLAGYRKDQTGIGRTNAATNAFRADTDWRLGSRNAATGEQNAATNAQNSQLTRERDIFNQGKPQFAPSEQEKAQQSVYADVAAEYPDFVEQGNGGFWQLKEAPDVGSPEYQVYQEMLGEVQRRTNNRIDSGNVDFGAGGDDMSDWTPVPRRR